MAETGAVPVYVGEGYSERVLAVGRFEYLCRSDRWVWSDGMYGIHGYERGEVVPTTALILAHKHPEDAAGPAAAFADLLHGRAAVISFHRIVSAGGGVRRVLAIAEAGRDGDAATERVHGYMLDLTFLIDQECRAASARAVAESARRRAVIEQAKGALMFCFGLDAEEAFARLSLYSQRANVKLAEVAGDLVGLFGEQGDRDGAVRLMDSIASANRGSSSG